MMEYRFTEYVENEVLRERPYIKKEWCIRVIEHLLKAGGRVWYHFHGAGDAHPEGDPRGVAALYARRLRSERSPIITLHKKLEGDPEMAEGRSCHTIPGLTTEIEAHL